MSEDTEDAALVLKFIAGAPCTPAGGIHSLTLRSCRCEFIAGAPCTPAGGIHSLTLRSCRCEFIAGAPCTPAGGIHSLTLRSCRCKFVEHGPFRKFYDAWRWKNPSSAVDHRFSASRTSQSIAVWPATVILSLVPPVLPITRAGTPASWASRRS